MARRDGAVDAVGFPWRFVDHLAVVTPQAQLGQRIDTLLAVLSRTPRGHVDPLSAAARSDLE